VRVLPRKNFDSAAHLLKFLDGMAEHKMQKAYRNQIETEKRSRSRRLSLEVCSVQVRDCEDKHADPAQQIDEEEQLGIMLSLLSQRHRTLVEGLRAGHRLKDLASELKVSVKTLRRAAARVAQQFREGSEGNRPDRAMG
jgi:DNA-binding NarL/FixJ family response regulator